MKQTIWGVNASGDDLDTAFQEGSCHRHQCLRAVVHPGLMSVGHNQHARVRLLKRFHQKFVDDTI